MQKPSSKNGVTEISVQSNDEWCKWLMGNNETVNCKLSGTNAGKVEKPK
jgi:hypothetical protein